MNIVADGESALIEGYHCLGHFVTLKCEVNPEGEILVYGIFTVKVLDQEKPFNLSDAELPSDELRYMKFADSEDSVARVLNFRARDGVMRSYVIPLFNRVSGLAAWLHVGILMPPGAQKRGKKLPLRISSLGLYGVTTV